jgi:hypothetical protein
MTDRLRTHEREIERNIDRYQNLLKTTLNDIEQQFVRQRISEERFRIALLRFMNPRPTSSIVTHDVPKVP